MSHARGLGSTKRRLRVAAHHLQHFLYDHPGMKLWFARVRTRAFLWQVIIHQDGSPAIADGWQHERHELDGVLTAEPHFPARCQSWTSNTGWSSRAVSPHRHASPSTAQGQVWAWVAVAPSCDEPGLSAQPEERRMPDPLYIAKSEADRGSDLFKRTVCQPFGRPMPSPAASITIGCNVTGTSFFATA